MNIYIGNLSYCITEDELKDGFTGFGEVTSINLIIDKFSGQSKDFGFIKMPNNAHADKAIQTLNDTDLNGRNI